MAGINSQDFTLGNIVTKAKCMKVQTGQAFVQYINEAYVNDYAESNGQAFQILENSIEKCHKTIPDKGRANSQLNDRPCCLDRQKSGKSTSFTDNAKNKNPIDKGWAWIVCFACFMQYVIFEGIFYTFGIMFSELTEHFKSSKTSTAWIMSINCGFCYTIGPLFSAVCDRFGFRAVSIAGCLITACGMVLSSFTPSIQFLYVSYGMVAGLGYGMVYLSATASVTVYFEKRRSLATGLAICGNGMGIFIMSPITEFLIQEYTWRGAILLQASFVLNGVIFGLMFRPLTINQQHKSDNPAFMTAETDNECKHCGAKAVNAHNIGTVTHTTGYEVSNCESCLSSTLANIQTDHTTHSNCILEDDRNSICKHCGSNDSEHNGHARAGKTNTYSAPSEENGVRLNCNASPVLSGNTAKPVDSTREAVDGEKLTCSAISKENGFLHTLDAEHVTAARLVFSCMCSFRKELYKIIVKSFDMSLLKQFDFCIYVISSALYSFIYYVPYIFLPDFAKYLGIDEFGRAWIVSAIGITNIFSRIGFGILADRSWTNRLYMYTIGMILAGVAPALTPLCKTYETVMFVSIIYGLIQGSNMVLQSVLVADIVGVINYAQGFAIMNCFSGIATVVGPPFAGWLFDVTGTYDLSFYVCGVLTSISGTLLLLIPCVNYMKKQ